MEHAITEKRTLVHRGSIVDVYSDDMLLPNGNHEVWDYVEHRMGAAFIGYTTACRAHHFIDLEI